MRKIIKGFDLPEEVDDLMHIVHAARSRYSKIKPLQEVMKEEVTQQSMCSKPDVVTGIMVDTKHVSVIRKRPAVCKEQKLEPLNSSNGVKEQYCLKRVGFHLNRVVPAKKPCLKPNPVIQKNAPDNLVQLSIVDGIEVVPANTYSISTITKYVRLTTGESKRMVAATRTDLPKISYVKLPDGRCIKVQPMIKNVSLNVYIAQDKSVINCDVSKLQNRLKRGGFFVKALVPEKNLIYN